MLGQRVLQKCNLGVGSLKIKFSKYLLVAILQAMLAVCRGIKMNIRRAEKKDI